MWHVRFGMQATPPVILTSCQGVKWTSQLQVVLRLGLNIFLEPWVKEKLFFISLPRLAIWMCLGAGLILFPYYMKKYGKDMPLPLLQNVSSHHRCASRSWSIDPISARMWILGQGLLVGRRWEASSTRWEMFGMILWRMPTFTYQGTSVHPGLKILISNLTWVIL